jgi:hypothetical protein
MSSPAKRSAPLRDGDDALLGGREAQALQHLGVAVAGMQVAHFQQRTHSSAPR